MRAPPRSAAPAVAYAQVAEPRWRYFWPVLGVAFALRAGVALSGDFMLHPDEIMQYLEPAHRLVFGNGVVYWEFLYGARSWLVPGVVAGVLAAFEAVGLGVPAWYVPGVELTFCALSLAVPAGMYAFARHRFGETAARAALLAGALWYELVGFAHKPMTEFVAAAPLVALLAFSAGPRASRAVWTPALLAVAAGAVRPQYAPAAVVLLGAVFVRSQRRAWLVAACAGLALAVGVFDAAAWDRGLFHSYLTNLRFNLALGEVRAGESPAWQFAAWFAVASAGLALASVAGALGAPRRYALPLALVAAIVGLHALEGHKEYRFVFAAIPLWLLIGADLAVRASGSAWVRRVRLRKAPAAAAAAVALAVSAAGLLNALPGQEGVYRAWSQETGLVRFLRGQDPVFAAYRALASAPDVGAVWHVDRPYYNTPGYYRLHRRIPFYDAFTGPALLGGAPLAQAVTHLVIGDPAFAAPGYEPWRRFGAVRVLHRAGPAAPVRRWRAYAPVVADERVAGIVRGFDAAAPAAPPAWGVTFAGPGSAR